MSNEQMNNQVPPAPETKDDGRKEKPAAQGKSEGRRPLTEAERQKRMKMLVYPAMGLLFVGSLWLIFKPSSADREKEQQGQGFNLEMPAPDDNGIIGDKKKAYEVAVMEERMQERNRAIQDLGALFNSEAMPQEADDEGDDYDLMHPDAAPQRSYGYGGGSSYNRRQMESSALAYRDLNNTLGSFYTTPAVDEEKEEMRERIEELEMRLAQQVQPAGTSLDDQMALMEKSYELAARYLPAQSGAAPTGAPATVPIAEVAADDAPAYDEGNAAAVKRVSHQVVSALAQPQSDEEFMAAYSQPRNYGFNTAVGTAEVSTKNTIAAYVYGAQTVTDGQVVRLRLSEPMSVEGTVIPQNTVVSGSTRIQGERLAIAITSIEFDGTILPVKLSVYDTDGQKGIFIPGSMEINAAKEVVANMGSSLGSSINISTDAGAQLASDLGRGVIQGFSQYVGRKMRTVKVHLKAGYRVMLFVDKD